MNKYKDITIEEYDLNELLKSLQKKFRIPYFQREYKWKSEQILELIEDIRSSESDHYYVGSIVLQNKHNTTWVIDGQQRISTFILILVALVKNDIFQNEWLNQIETYLKNIEIVSENIKDSKFLKKIIEHELIKNKNYRDIEDIEKSIYYSNFKAILKKLKSLTEEENEILIKRMKGVIFSKVEVTSNKIDENILFEKINSSGLPLSQYDLVKNYLLSKIYKELDQSNENETDIDFYNQEMNSIFEIKENSKKKEKVKDEILRVFLAYSTRVLFNNDEIYKEFKRYYNNLKEEKNKAQILFDDLYKFVTYYKFIFEKEWSEYEKIKSPMITIYEQINTYMALLIKVFEMYSTYKNKKIIIEKEDEIVKVLLLIEAYIFRRAFVNLKPKIISRKMSSFKFSDETKLTFAQYLYKELYLIPRQETNALYRLPSIEEVKLAFKNDLNVYNLKGICKLFLFRLGTYNSKEVFDIEKSKFSIEHVLPQKYDNWYSNLSNEEKAKIEIKLQTLGNLTLTTYNSEYSNSIFEIKKDMMFQKDNFPLNKYFLSKNIWGIKEIDERTTFLINEMNKIWDFDYLDSFFEKNKDLITKNENDRNSLNNNFNKKYYFDNYDFNNDKNFKSALKNKTHFKKVKEKIDYELIQNVIKSYASDGLSYEDIEWYYFKSNFNGWLGQSIVEALDIKDDKGKISNNFDSYINSIEEDIAKLKVFVDQIE